MNMAIPVPAPIPAALSDDGLALVRDFAARYGEGLRLGLSLGGGGLYFIAWQVAYLHELSNQGIHLDGADRVVGTSAGSMVAAVLGAGNLPRFFTEVSLLAKVPQVVHALAPAGQLGSSQERAANLFAAADNAEPETIQAIGHAALAARTPLPPVMERNVSLILASRRWPTPDLYLTAVDTFSGERCIITRSAGVPIARAVAASSAVPGIFPPQPIGERRCMDGGVSGTGIHLDLLAGARKAVVLALTDGLGIEGVDEAVGIMTTPPHGVVHELDDLAHSGTDVFFRKPESIDLLRLMDPTAVPEALAMGRRQAEGDADELRAFLAR